jgi:hypothetical protein
MVEIDVLQAENTALVSDLDWIGWHLTKLWIGVGHGWEMEWVDDDGAAHTTHLEHDRDSDYAGMVRKIIAKARGA